MSKFSKISLIGGAVALILMDIWVLVSSLGNEPKEIFNNIMWNLVPCGILLGAVSLSSYFGKSYKKPLAIISGVVFGIIALFRTLSIALFIYDRATIANLNSMDYSEYTKLVELVGYTVLMVAGIFFVKYLLSGILKKLCGIMSGIAFALVGGGLIFNIYKLIDSAIFYDAGFSETITALVDGGLIWSLILLLAYITQFAFHLGVIDTPLKKED